MSAEFSVHNVDRITVCASTVPSDDGKTYWWQTMRFFDCDNNEIGKVVVFLDRPDAALPVGDQPPYWGMDLNKPALLSADGEAPF